jgi:hypothetical protein
MANFGFYIALTFSTTMFSVMSLDCPVTETPISIPRLRHQQIFVVPFLQASTITDCNLPNTTMTSIGNLLRNSYLKEFPNAKPVNNFKKVDESFLFAMVLVNQTKEDFNLMRNGGQNEDKSFKVLKETVKGYVERKFKHVKFDDYQDGIKHCFMLESNTAGDYKFLYHHKERGDNPAVFKRYHIYSATIPGSDQNQRQILISLLFHNSVWEPATYQVEKKEWVKVNNSEEGHSQDIPVTTESPFCEKRTCSESCGWLWAQGCRKSCKIEKVLCPTGTKSKPEIKRTEEERNGFTQITRKVTLNKQMTLRDRSRKQRHSLQHISDHVLLIYGGYLN